MGSVLPRKSPRGLPLQKSLLERLSICISSAVMSLVRRSNSIWGKIFVDITAVLALAVAGAKCGHIRLVPVARGSRHPGACLPQALISEECWKGDSRMRRKIDASLQYTSFRFLIGGFCHLRLHKRVSLQLFARLLRIWILIQCHTSTHKCRQLLLIRKLERPAPRYMPYKGTDIFWCTQKKSHVLPPPCEFLPFFRVCISEFALCTYLISYAFCRLSSNMSVSAWWWLNRSHGSVSEISDLAHGKSLLPSGYAWSIADLQS